MMGRGRDATSLVCTPEREMEVEAVSGRGEMAGGAYKRASGIWRKRRLVVLRAMGKIVYY